MPTPTASSTAPSGATSVPHQGLASHDDTAGESWLGVGASDLPGAADAVEAALSRALASRRPVLVLLFVTPSHDMAVVAAQAAALLPRSTRVVGCTTAGEIGEGSAGSGRVVAVALGGVQVGVQVGDLAAGARAAGVRAASAIEGVVGPHRTLMLVGDGFLVSRAEIVRGAYGVVGATVPLVGGCAGDELAMQRTWQIVDGEVLDGVVVGVALGSDRPLVVGIGHGWQPMGEPVVVTSSDGATISTLDDEPALDRFLSLVGAPEAARHDPSLFFGYALRFTLGLPRPGGEEVRAVLGADYERRTLSCSDVPQGTTVRVMSGDADTVQEGTREAARQVLDALGGQAPRGVIAFDCAARRMLLGPEGMQEEADLLDELLQAPVGGFYTYGEFARTRGSRGVHNATLVLLALG